MVVSAEGPESVSSVPAGGEEGSETSSIVSVPVVCDSPIDSDSWLGFNWSRLCWEVVDDIRLRNDVLRLSFLSDRT